MELRKYLYICGVELQQEVSRCSGLGAMMAILTKGQVAWAACLCGMDSRGGGRDAVCVRNVAIFRQVTKFRFAFSFAHRSTRLGGSMPFVCIRRTLNSTILNWRGLVAAWCAALRFGPW